MRPIRRDEGPETGALASDREVRCGCEAHKRVRAVEDRGVDNEIGRNGEVRLVKFVG